MGQIFSILLLLMTLIAEASLESKSLVITFFFLMIFFISGLVWLTAENQIQILSESRNETISLAEGRHILGLSSSSPASGTVYVTELGISGPSVFRVRAGAGEQPSKILSPEGELKV